MDNFGNFTYFCHFICGIFCNTFFAADSHTRLDKFGKCEAYSFISGNSKRFVDSKANCFVDSKANCGADSLTYERGRLR